MHSCTQEDVQSQVDRGVSGLSATDPVTVKIWLIGTSSSLGAGAAERGFLIWVVHGSQQGICFQLFHACLTGF